MSRLVTIDIEELRKIMREETINTLAGVMDMLREGEAIVSTRDIEKNRQLQEQLSKMNDTLLTGREVAQRLGCSSSQVTKLKLKGVLEPIYPLGSRTPKYSRLKLEQMIKSRTIPCFR